MLENGQYLVLHERNRLQKRQLITERSLQAITVVLRVIQCHKILACVEIFWLPGIVAKHNYHQILKKASSPNSKKFQLLQTPYARRNKLQIWRCSRQHWNGPQYYYTNKQNLIITTRRIPTALEVRIIFHNCLRAPIKFASKYVPNTICILQIFHPAAQVHHRCWSIAFSINDESAELIAGSRTAKWVDELNCTNQRSPSTRNTFQAV